MLVNRLLLLTQAVASCAATGSFHQKVKGKVVTFAPWGGNLTNSTNATTTTAKSHASTTLRTTTLDTIAAEETATAADKTDETQANPSTEANANSDKPSETTAAVSEPSNSSSSSSSSSTNGGGHRLWSVNATSYTNTTTASDMRNTTTPLFPAANSTTPQPLSSPKNTTTSSSNSTTCGIPGSYLTPPTTALKADSILACQAACQRDPTCRSFETGTVDGDGNNCWLFPTPLVPSSSSSSSSSSSAAAANIGPVRDGFTWRFYDRDCDLGVRSRCGLRGSFITPPTRKLRVASLAACRAACAGGNGGCRTFEGGTVDGSGHNCWLFDVPVAELDMGGATTGWQWAFFDRDCKV